MYALKSTELTSFAGENGSPGNSWELTGAGFPHEGTGKNSSHTAHPVTCVISAQYFRRSVIVSCTILRQRRTSSADASSKATPSSLRAPHHGNGRDGSQQPVTEISTSFSKPRSRTSGTNAQEWTGLTGLSINQVICALILGPSSANTNNSAIATNGNAVSHP